MKILILSPKLPYPPKDGGSVATLNIATGLSDCGNEITLLCLNTVKHFFPEDKIPSALSAKIRFFTAFHDTSPNKVSAFLNLLFSRKPYIAVRFVSSAFRKKLTKLLDKEQFDIIHLEGPYLYDYFKIIRKHSNALLSFRAQNVESEIWKGISKNTRSLLKKLYIRNLSYRIQRLEKKVIRDSDLFVPISPSDCQTFLSFRKNIPYLVNPTGFYISDTGKNKVKYNYSLFFLGALDWKPNQEGLLWFIHHVWAASSFNTEFHVAGRQAPEWLKRKLRNVKGLVFHGEIENSIDFINESGIMVCPIFTGSGIRIKMLEAMMMGKTILSTSKGAEGIPVTDGIHCFLCDTPNDFIQKIKLLEKHPEYEIKIGSNAKRFVMENFNNLALCKDLSDFYRKNLK